MWLRWILSPIVTTCARRRWPFDVPKKSLKQPGVEASTKTRWNQQQWQKNVLPCSIRPPRCAQRPATISSCAKSDWLNNSRRNCKPRQTSERRASSSNKKSMNSNVSSERTAKSLTGRALAWIRPNKTPSKQNPLQRKRRLVLRRSLEHWTN